MVPLAAKICPFSVGLSTWWKECDLGSGGNCIPGGLIYLLLILLLLSLLLLLLDLSIAALKLHLLLSSVIPSTEWGLLDSLWLRLWFVTKVLWNPLEWLPISEPIAHFSYDCNTYLFHSIILHSDIDNDRQHWTILNNRLFYRSIADWYLTRKLLLFRRSFFSALQVLRVELHSSSLYLLSLLLLLLSILPLLPALAKVVGCRTVDSRLAKVIIAFRVK